MVGLRTMAMADPAIEEPRDPLAGEISPAVRRALAELPAAQREALLLKHVEDLSYEEIAQITGVRISALKMRVKRGLEALARSVERRTDEI